MSTPRKKVTRRSAKKAKPTAPRSQARNDQEPQISRKLAALIRKHWPEQGKAERIARAQKAWKEMKEIAATFKNIDDETWKYIALSKDVEYY